MRILPQMILCCAVILLHAAMACGTDYLHVNYANAAGHVTLNGFSVGDGVPVVPEHHNSDVTVKDQRRHSIIMTHRTEVAENNTLTTVGQYLTEGTNVIEITYHPDAQQSMNSTISWKMTATAAHQNSDDPHAKVLTSGVIGGHKLAWSGITAKDFTASAGAFDPKNGITFAIDGEKMRWGGQLSHAQALSGLPSSMKYLGLTCKLKNVALHFQKSGTPIDVVYAGLTLPVNEGKLELPHSKITAGKQWAEEHGFDKVLIEGYNPGAKFNAIQVEDLQFDWLPVSVIERHEFTVHTGYVAAWQPGKLYNRLSEQDKNDIFQVVQQFHRALSARNYSIVKTMLDTELRAQYAMPGMKPKDIDALERSSYQYLFSRPGFQMRPLLKEQLKYILLNPRVVAVRNTAGSQALQYHCRSSHDDGSFSIWLSNINGRWTIVRHM